jgi:molybdopterin synthase sulfur carrier subunit
VARLLLFAQAREVAGLKELQLPGETVGAVLSAACERFGGGLEQVLASSAVWVNGEPARADHPVGEEDEVAILPPVSGG